MQSIDESSLTRHSHAGSDIVRVLVGRGRKLYICHKMLTSHRPFSAKYLKPPFLEGVSNEAVLEDERAREHSTNFFFQRVYTQTIETQTQTEIPFAAVYILADKFCMGAFKNAIVDAAVDYCERKPMHLEGLTLLVGHNLSSSHLAGVFLNKITLDIVKRRGSRYSRDEEQLRTFSNPSVTPK
jgi:hypothetical protein